MKPKQNEKPPGQINVSITFATGKWNVEEPNPY